LIDRWCNALSLITPYDFCIPVTRKLSPESARDSDLQKLGRDDAMATEKLAEGTGSSAPMR
jgi:hypothetical protein